MVLSCVFYNAAFADFSIGVDNNSNCFVLVKGSTAGPNIYNWPRLTAGNGVGPKSQNHNLFRTGVYYDSPIREMTSMSLTVQTGMTPECDAEAVIQVSNFAHITARKADECAIKASFALNMTQENNPNLTFGLVYSGQGDTTGGTLTICIPDEQTGEYSSGCGMVGMINNVVIGNSHHCTDADNIGGGGSTGG
ncbi:MAG: hypothetical protein A2624_03145 [Gammaproteobacteria bacterium RIFCSPHIGHO2_01_FULL_42_8]|nr:MAG: hypothetical protein A2624_03145 [Gammaproteobacteria bacterium RIFCSPHIGHO2_01_FULL_42_8]